MTLAVGDPIAGIQERTQITLHHADGSFLGLAPRLVARAIANARDETQPEVLRGRVIDVGAEVTVQLCLVAI